MSSDSDSPKSKRPKSGSKFLSDHGFVAIKDGIKSKADSGPSDDSVAGGRRGKPVGSGAFAFKKAQVVTCQGCQRRAF